MTKGKQGKAAECIKLLQAFDVESPEDAALKVEQPVLTITPFESRVHTAVGGVCQLQVLRALSGVDWQVAASVGGASANKQSKSRTHFHSQHQRLGGTGRQGRMVTLQGMGRVLAGMP